MRPPIKLKFLQDNKDKIIEEYKSGMSSRQLAKKYNMAKSYILYFLKINNIKMISSHNIHKDLRSILMTDIQKQLIIGTLLGDGCLETHTGKNFCLSMAHGIAQKEWLDSKIKILSPFVVSKKYYKDERGVESYGIRTCSHPDLIDFGKNFYIPHPNPAKHIKRLKIVPEGLEKYFTPIALCTWYLDDGNLSKSNCMSFATHGFTLESNLRLVKYLKDCFNINACIKSNAKYHYIILDRIESIKIYDLIKDLDIFPECLKYKINITNFKDKLIKIDSKNFHNKQIINMYNNGKTISRIERKTHISKENILKILNNNVTWRKYDGLKFRIVTDEDIINLYESGYTPSRIASFSKKSTEDILCILNQNNIIKKINRPRKENIEYNNEQIISMFNNGIIVNNIVKKTNKSKKEVIKILNDAEVVWRKKSIFNIDENNKLKLLKMFDDGYSINEIQKQFFGRKSSIIKLLKINGKIL